MKKITSPPNAAKISFTRAQARLLKRLDTLATAFRLNADATGHFHMTAVYHGLEGVRLIANADLKTRENCSTTFHYNPGLVGSIFGPNLGTSVSFSVSRPDEDPRTKDQLDRMDRALADYNAKRMAEKIAERRAQLAEKAAQREAQLAAEKAERARRRIQASQAGQGSD